MGPPSPAQLAYMLAHADESRRAEFLWGSLVPLFFAGVAFGLRFVARKVGGVKLGMEDWLIVVGMFFTTAGVVALVVAAHYGLGRHVVFVKDKRGFAISCLFRYVLYPLSVCFIKLSILAFYCRVFPMRWLKHTALALGTFIVAATLTKVMGDIFQCLPVDSAWNPTPNKKCINFVSLVIVSGVLNIVTDFIILALPVPVLWRLKVTRVKKWELIGVFLAGCLVCVISVVRLPIVQKLKSNDPSWDLFGPLTISAVESCAAIIAACIPTYRPLFENLRQWLNVRKASRGQNENARISTPEGSSSLDVEEKRDSSSEAWPSASTSTRTLDGETSREHFYV
ncbi:hypothetical protein EJ04DRAFT_460651 [Polyplosphaeria fusca]|uniref:Rhodopsin domain-containing protein n=1 Tax=Polyplosphaeria fusca TaxID=682080 RepID=A0A9P4V2X5_9PLEO|nr:hypothetical protein EJ04DRAFT_460651 [Polyplosphaeria fusca]